MTSGWFFWAEPLGKSSIDYPVTRVTHNTSLERGCCWCGSQVSRDIGKRASDISMQTKLFYSRKINSSSWGLENLFQWNHEWVDTFIIRKGDLCCELVSIFNIQEVNCSDMAGGCRSLCGYCIFAFEALGTCSFLSSLETEGQCWSNKFSLHSVRGEMNLRKGIVIK